MTTKTDKNSSKERILPLPALPPEIKAAVNQSELVVFIGAGVSRIIGCKSWSELANELVEVCFDKGCINFKEKESLLKERNQKKKISICQHILAKKEGNLFLDAVAKSLQSDKNKAENFPIYKELHRLRAVYVTTNVDTCFDDLYFKDLIIYLPQDFNADGIDREHLYHLHGTIKDQKSLILTVRNYLDLYADSNVKKFLKKLFEKYSVLFVGYGMDEFEILDFLLQKAEATKKERKHFILLPMFRGEENILAFEESHYSDLGITVIPYAIDDNGYEQLYYVIENFEKEINLSSTFLYDSFEKIEKSIEHYDPESAKLVFQLIRNDSPLEDHFFKKLNSIEWLLPLKKEGYFDPSKNPKPKPSEKEGFYTVPYWNVLNYLVKVSEQIGGDKEQKYAEDLMAIIRSIAAYREQGKPIENYRTNWALIKMVSNLHPSSIKNEDIEIVRQFLVPGWENSVIALTIVEDFFPKLLKNSEKEKLLKLLEIVLSVHWVKGIHGEEPKPFLEEYSLNKLVEKNKTELSTLYPLDTAQIIIAKIEEIVAGQKFEFGTNQVFLVKDDSPSYLENRFQNVIGRLARDLLSAGISKDPTTAKNVLKELLVKDHPIFKRLSLSVIDANWNTCSDLFFSFAQKQILTDYDLKYEVYAILDKHYDSFSTEMKDAFLGWIDEGPDWTRKEQSEEEFQKTIAYWKQGWLSALLSSGYKKAIDAYDKYKKITQMEPRRYEPVQPVVIQFQARSPIDAQDLAQKTNEDVAQYLKSYKEDKSSWEAPSIEGLGSALCKAVKSNPIKFDSDLKPFLDVPFIYQHEIMRGFTDAWKEKKDIGWKNVLNYCKTLISQEVFWREYERTESQRRNWLISQIADLIIEGTQDDAHVCPPDNLPIIEEIVLKMLEKTETDIQYPNDLLTATLNSAKGRVICALINYTLRIARLNREKAESVRWSTMIKNEFTRRLDRTTEPSLEWSLSLGEYLPNLYYLDKDWVKDNIDKIFFKENRDHWTAAMEGYLALPQVYAPLYNLLKTHNHYREAISADMKKDTRERLVDHLCIGYLRGEESLTEETSLFRQCLNDWKIDDVLNMISFFWMQRKNLVGSKSPTDSASEKLTKKHKQKILDFCSYIYDKLNGKSTYSDDEKKILSRVCLLSCFIDKISETDLLWLELAAKFTDDINSIFFIEYLDKLCDVNPYEVGAIFFILSDHLITYTHEEQIRSIVTKLYSKGERDYAIKICNTFFSKGLEFLRDIYETNKQAT